MSGTDVLRAQKRKNVRAFWNLTVVRMIIRPYVVENSVIFNGEDVIFWETDKSLLVLMFGLSIGIILGRLKASNRLASIHFHKPSHSIPPKIQSLLCPGTVLSFK